MDLFTGVARVRFTVSAQDQREETHLVMIKGSLCIFPCGESGVSR